MAIEIPLLFLILLAKANTGKGGSFFGNLFGGAQPAQPPLTQQPPPQLPAAPPATPQAAAAPSLAKTPRTAPPWPQVVPADLPPFPAGWTPASPVTAAIRERAFALLPQLWAHGEGTWKPEQTGARWVVYQARMTLAPDGTTKTGVVAFTAPSQAPEQSAFSVTPGASLLPSEAVPARRTVPASASQAAAPATNLPTLRKGSRGPSVVWLQQKLGIPADGNFGSGTQAAVVGFQQSHGLSADGVVGPATWAALGGSARAA